MITTTDFWWHVAGLREYVARGNPIYVLDRNVRVVTGRAKAPHTFVPTVWPGLRARPLSSLSIPVRQSITPSGTSSTPPRGQLCPSGLSFPQTAIEVVGAVEREGLTPETFIGMHVAATPWTRLTSGLDSLARR